MPHPPAVRRVSPEVLSRGGGGGNADRPYTPRTHAVVRTVELAAGGTVLCSHQSANLVGMAAGERRDLGTLHCGDLSLCWGYWFPHLGIAVDDRPVPPDEEDAKLQWATERGVLYFSPGVNTDTPGRLDLSKLRDAVTERRAAAMGAG